jgi:predicted esterase
MKTLSIQANTHGRVLVVDPFDGRAPEITLVGFHGYAQNADDMMTELQAIPGSVQWQLISVQGLHRFYTRGDQKIVASWMTRQDRDEAIADNVAYVDRVLANVGPNEYVGPNESVGPNFSSGVYFLGFSQGAAMAYRAAVLGQHRPAGVIAIGGDVPPDTKTVPADRWPRVLIAGGQSDQWFNAGKVDADASFLAGHGVAHEVLRYSAGHEITDEVRARVAAFVRS